MKYRIILSLLLILIMVFVAVISTDSTENVAPEAVPAGPVANPTNFNL